MATKIRQSNLDPSVITGNTELAANSAADDVLLVFDASSGTLKKIQSSNVGVQVPTITTVSPSNVLNGDGTGNHTFTITGTGFTSDVTAKITTNGGTDIAFSSVTRNSSTQLTCVVAKNASNLTNANEPFDISVTTAGALTATKADAFTIDASPVFVTASGSLGSGTGNSAASFSVNATDPESNATQVSFELQSGTLPPGLSLTNTNADGGTAIISGTATDPAATTTYNFVLRAVDAASNTTSRAFSITINKQIQYQSFTSSGTFAVPSGLTTLNEVLVVAGGGGGGKDGGGGGGAGGLIFMPNYPVTPGGTITVTVGCGGAGGSSPSPVPLLYGVAGQDSVFGAPGDPGKHPTGDVLTAKGGGGGGGGPGGPRAGQNGGSGGGSNGHGANYQNYAPASTATQPTQPGDSGAYGFGHGGGRGIHTGQTPQNHLSAGGGGGAGAVGQNGNYTGPTAGGGGAGKAYTIADGTTPVYYAGGGAGTNNGVGPGANARPQGGGGQCSGDTSQGFTDAIANRGSGGGSNCGGTQAGPQAGSGQGGKGIVIIKY